jgi:hypothetical protein
MYRNRSLFSPVSLKFLEGTGNELFAGMDLAESFLKIV